MTEHTPTPEEQADLDAADVLRAVIGEWCEAERIAGTAPTVVAQKILDVIGGILMEAMGGGAVRQALLVIHELTFENPTNFIDRAKIKDQVEAISDARRKTVGTGTVLAFPNKLDS